MEDSKNIKKCEEDSDELDITWDEIDDNWDTPLDKIIPNRAELSREEISKQIFKFVNDNYDNDPDIEHIEDNEEDMEKRRNEEYMKQYKKQHDSLMKVLGIEDELLGRPPLTFRDLQEEIIARLEGTDGESESESESENDS